MAETLHRGRKITQDPVLYVSKITGALVITLQGTPIIFIQNQLSTSSQIFVAQLYTVRKEVPPPLGDVVANDWPESNILDTKGK